MAEDLKKELEKQQELMRTKDIYIKRLNAEIQEVKNELKRSEDKLKKQTDKALGEFMKSLAEIFTRVDAGYVDFKDDMSDSRQMSYTLSKFKTTLQLQNIEVMVPNVLENYDIDEMEVTDVIPTGDKNLDKKVVHIDRVGFRNKITRVILVQPQVITYKYDESLDVEGLSNKDKAMAAMKALNDVLGNREDGGSVSEDSALGEQMLQMMNDSGENKYNLKEVDEAAEARKIARKLSEKAHRAEEAKNEAMRKADEARKEADKLYIEAAEAEDKKIELEKIAEEAIAKEEARIAEEERLKEEARLAELARQEEERKRREEEERKRKEEEERRIAEAKAEAERLEAEAKAEAERLEAERQAKEAEIAEKQRKLAEIREAARLRAEEARKAAEEAARQAEEEEARLLAELEAESQATEAQLAEKAKAAEEAKRQAEMLQKKKEAPKEEPKVEEPKVEEAAPVAEEPKVEEAPKPAAQPQKEPEKERRGLFGFGKKKEDKKAESVKSAWEEMARAREEKAREERARQERYRGAQSDDIYNPPIFDLGNDPLQDIPQEGQKKKRSNR